MIVVRNTTPRTPPPRVIEACPGDGTRYVMVVTPITEDGAARALGAVAPAMVVALWPGDRRSASCVVSCDSSVSASYLAEKLRLGTEAAERLASVVDNVRVEVAS